MRNSTKAVQAPQIMVLLLVAGLAPTTAEARFLAEDADQIDPEERFSTETYNDKVSYRFPVDWDRLWEARDVGYRVSAGSLNVSRFDYAEDIKLGTGDDGPMSMAFRQSRREDTVEQRTERELQLGWRVAESWRVFLLGDGGTFKEYGDIGGGFGYRLDRARTVRAYYWSVDHYYETKKTDAEDDRLRKPDSVGLDADWRFSDVARIAAAVEVDQPLRWRRPSRGYVYDYERRLLTHRSELRLIDGWSGVLSGRHEWKTEFKSWVNQAGLEHSKGLRRQVDQVEIAGIKATSEGDLAVGLELVSRDARYRFAADPALSRVEYQEDPGPARSSRREGGLYGTWHFPYVPPRHFLQVGAHLNQVQLTEGEKLAATEVKSQIAWDYRFAEGARLLLNTSWDLDQLQKDFPYDERPFRPWGGGNIQVMATF